MASNTSSERRWVWLYAILLIAVTSIPYLIGHFNQSETYEFTGFVFGVNDGNSYISKMLAGEHGDWLFRTPYTTFPQDGILVYLPYILLGKLATTPVSHRELVLIFHLFRITAVFLIVFATYDFLALFFNRVTSRRISLVLITIGGGLGWLLVLLGKERWLGSLPLEYFSPESFGFLAIFGLPHLALARALMLWGFVILIRSSFPQSFPKDQIQSGWNKSVLWPGFITGIIWIGVGLIQPINLAIAALLLGLYLVTWKGFQLFKNRQIVKPEIQSWRRMALTTMISGVVALPFVLFLGYDLLTDPFFREWGRQNVLYSPHFAHYLLAYGILLPLVIVGIIQGWRSQNRTLFLFPTLWFIIFPILAYLPVSIQRRLPEGVWIGVVILAVFGFEYLARLPRKRYKHLAIIAFALCLPATLILVMGGTLTTLNTTTAAFRPGDEVRVFQELADQGEKGGLVLSSFETGNALPAWVPMRVVIGHGPESIELQARTSEIITVYDASTIDILRQNILEELGVDYVFWGPEERLLGGWDPGKDPNFGLITKQGEYAVFKIIPYE